MDLFTLSTLLLVVAALCAYLNTRLLFGALISPTDPIAVLGILAKFKLPESVKLNIVGESLFTDGVGVVVFATIFRIVTEPSTGVNATDIGLTFLEEAGAAYSSVWYLGTSFFGCCGLSTTRPK